MEVLQCVDGGTALGSSFRGAIPGADDDIPDWSSREHGRPAKKQHGPRLQVYVPTCTAWLFGPVC